MIDDYLIPATRAQYYALAASVKRERGDGCLSLGATLSASEGTMWGGGPVMMTTWELDDYPLLRVEQTNNGQRLTHDERDRWAYWINADHAWRVGSTPASQESTAPTSPPGEQSSSAVKALT